MKYSNATNVETMREEEAGAGVVLTEVVASVTGAFIDFARRMEAGRCVGWSVVKFLELNFRENGFLGEETEKLGKTFPYFTILVCIRAVLFVSFLVITRKRLEIRKKSLGAFR